MFFGLFEAKCTYLDPTETQQLKLILQSIERISSFRETFAERFCEIIYMRSSDSSKIFDEELAINSVKTTKIIGQQSYHRREIKKAKNCGEISIKEARN